MPATQPEGPNVSANIDTAAVIRLAGFTRRAIDAQDVHVRDQLNTAVDRGDMKWRFEEGESGVPVAVVEVGGYRLAEVDIRELVPLDDVL